MMRGGWLLAASCIALATAASADDVQDWRGTYIGINAGWMFGTFKTVTHVDAGSYFGAGPHNFTAADIDGVNTAGRHGVTGNGFAGGLQFGHNWQSGPFVAGLETDADFSHMADVHYGSSYYGAPPDRYGFASRALQNTYAAADWLVTLRSRLGYAESNRLFYVTGGLALAAPHVDYTFVDYYNANETAKRGALKAGYVIGAGLEWAFSNRLSLKTEFQHIALGTANAVETASNLVPPAYTPAQRFWHSASFHPDLLRIGLNYRFGETGEPAQAASDLPEWLADWQIETGVRVMASNGDIGAVNPLLHQTGLIPSRLLYSDLRGLSGEFFARADHASGLFAKAFIGAGGVVSGVMHDEDFGLAYSNTISQASGSLGYANGDVGYRLIRSPDADFSVFAGYDYFRDQILTYGCTQIAKGTPCPVTSISATPGKANIARQVSFNAVRLGASSRFRPAERLRFEVEAAWMPWVTFDGNDDHINRQTLMPQSASAGDGAMLEGRLAVDVTDAWSAGIGGRLWLWTMHNGNQAWIYAWGTDPNVVYYNQPARFDGEHYGLFLETSYRFGGHEEEHSAGSETVDWTGLYAGVTLGAGWSDASWDDPYPSWSPYYQPNTPGFNDVTHAPGIAAGGRLVAEKQIGSWVIGLQADGAWMNARYRNTCYSGVGGVDCAQRVHAVYDLALRGGYAFDRSLVYLKAGEALVSAQYLIDGNTVGLCDNNDFTMPGRGSDNALVRGWLIGAGLEYRIDEHWSTGVEYNRIDGMRATLAFPDIAVIGSTPHKVWQTLDMIQVGLSYKLG